MKKKLIYLLILVLFISCDSQNEDEGNYDMVDNPSETSFYRGMDLSFLPENESLGVVYKDENNQLLNDNYAYLSNSGVNLVRVRLWENHIDQEYNLQNLKTQALKIKAAGMDLLLDFHYSDTWADPGRQNIPAAWQGLTIQELSIAVNNYTTQVINELKNQGTAPDIVQIGNETNNGLLWPLGKIYENGNEDFDNYVQITNAAISAVRSTLPETQIMIHHAGVSDAGYFFEQLNNRNVDFNIAGLSYYPWWHGSNMSTIETDLNSLAIGIEQKIMIVETAYPFTLNWNDNLNNIIGLNNQLAPNYPASFSGQKDFLMKIKSMLKGLPDNKGIGFCYWAPDWVAHVRGDQSFMNGSSWENLALFDFNHKATPSIEVFAAE